MSYKEKYESLVNTIVELDEYVKTLDSKGVREAEIAREGVLAIFGDIFLEIAKLDEINSVKI